MKIGRTAGLAIFAGVLSISIFGLAAYAYFEAAPTPPPATDAFSAPSPAPSASVAPPAGQPAPDALREALKGLTVSAAQYLGVQPMDLMTQLKAGKSLTDIATATPGKSRDGLVAALTIAANTKIDQAVKDGTLTPDQAAKAKRKLAGEISKLVDRAGHP